MGQGSKTSWCETPETAETKTPAQGRRTNKKPARRRLETKLFSD